MTIENNINCHMTPRQAFLYAEEVLGAPFPEGEKVISQSAAWSLDYANSVLGKRFIEGEKMIGRCPRCASEYAILVLKERWKDKSIESIIFSDVGSWSLYSKEFAIEAKETIRETDKIKTHHLKIKEIYFDAIQEGKKTCEILKNDRDFRVGDIVVLRARLGNSRVIGSDEIKARVTWVDTYQQQEDYVVLSFEIDTRGE